MAYAPPNGPAGDKNAHRRSIIWIIRPINGTFVGRMLLRPTQGHENAVRLGHTTTVKQSNAPRFTHFTAWNPLKMSAVEACTDVGWGERKNSQPRYLQKVLTAS